jgi:phosphatidylglycerol:prolipoprotein diacylglycerol transferase
MWPTLFKIPILDIPIRGYGLMLMIAFLGGTWWAARRAMRVKCNPDLVVNLGLVALLSSIVGARVFYVIHYWEAQFQGRGLWAVVDVSAGGLEFYGGLLGALLAVLLYLYFSGVSVRLYLDIITPSLMFGMGMARIGCFLNGCCWGGMCPEDMAWGVTFPYASPAYVRQWENRQITVPAELLYINADGEAYPLPREAMELSPEERANPGGCRQSTRLQKASLAYRYNNQLKKFDMTSDELDRLASRPENRTRHLHPAQLYASIDGLLLAVLLAAIFHRRKRHGLVFGLLLLMYPPVRIIEEIIRIDNPHDTAGLTISQFISVALILVGVVYMIAIHRMPLRSPGLKPYEPPTLAAETETAPPRRDSRQRSRRRDRAR